MVIRQTLDGLLMMEFAEFTEWPFASADVSRSFLWVKVACTQGGRSEI